MNTRIFLLLLCIACVVYTGFVYRSGDSTQSPKAVRLAAMNGQQIWQEKNCQSCHQLYGLGGYMGPDLTNAAAKGPDYLRAFIEHGTTRMPDFHLSDKEQADVVAFLQWVDQSGNNKVPDSCVHWTGSYSLNP